MAAVILALYPSAALAAPPPPDPKAQIGDLMVDPRELKAGDEVKVAGSGCTSRNQVQFELYSPKLRSTVAATAKSDGTFAQTIRFPSTTNVGRTWLRATCLTPDSNQRVMEAVLLVSRPDFLITGINLAFGVGSALVIFGLGVLALKDAKRRPS